MDSLYNISNAVSQQDPLLMIYEDRITLNSVAAALLKIGAAQRINFKFSAQEHDIRKAFVGRCRYDGFPVAAKGKAMRVSNKRLAQDLANILDGYGTYRIESTVTKADFNGDIYFNIFNKNYGKRR